MTQLEKFHETINILVKAYLNDTLKHNDCSKCAVGNIVLQKQGFVNGHMGGWANVFMTLNDSSKQPQERSQRISTERYSGSAKREIDSTGYNVLQLAKIEFAFETALFGKSGEEWMFNGLMAVVDVLAEIHGVDLKTKETACKLFVK